ncbi:non-hydrolyzing UDP-N-acetylglucosamine 2-epimerase [Dethiosulfatarculus sandiegensis]|uniref:UDP-N-acetylglucosamine 2-epimerase n=1 Tax=Dethiosulfatarculus sandiegensis TaxID=1429043 RepID=A0A0D2J6U5_9BACT|nr:UDP-N-acetylglucosamine 2-epimerase (non-hydrolyzing) [Dethiosulfatarculus sandiegensis]KIX11401.1 UDP-N-acetylglucosamine 2-epimerase [Dethiosulfatarculus sandiegensis]
MNIVTVIGARPQFIKAAVTSRLLAYHDDMQDILLHTGQHYDTVMSQIFFDELMIPEPSYNLGVGGGTHGQNTGRMLEAIEKVLIKEKPDWVLVYGDTDSTLAGALAAVKLQIPIAHVEAGLRSFNRRMPEEINRVLTDHAAQVLFAPTTPAVENLAKEGISKDKIHQVGDVMYDAALFYAQKAEEKSYILNELGLKSQDFILATVHRPQNVDNPALLANIIQAFDKIADEIPVVFPVHPRTRNKLKKLTQKINSKDSFKLIEPVGYLDMVMLEKNAAAIATDSGGVQREAFFHNVPSVVLRDETEWVELLRLGWSRLANVKEPDDLIQQVKNALNFPLDSKESPYGHGDTGQKIIQVLKGVN